MQLKKWLVVILLLTPALANAVIIEGNFSGWVFADESDEGVWSKNMRGEEISGHLRYDTDLAPAADPNYPYTSRYASSGTNSWLSLTYFIDGKTWDISSMVQNNYDPTTGELLDIDAETDLFSLLDHVMSLDPQGDYKEYRADVGFRGPADHIQTEDLVQEFSWNHGDSYAGMGTIWLRERHGGVETFAYLEMYLTEMTVAVAKGTPVPAPSAISLLFIGLIALGFNRKRNHIRFLP